MTKNLDFYQEQARKTLSALPWLAQLQLEASKNLDSYGFPTRNDEDWHYTPVEGLLEQPFMASDLSSSSAESHLLTYDAPIKQQLFIDNGVIFGEKQLAQSLPEAVKVLPLSQAFTQYPQLLKSYLGKILKQEHALHFLNTAMLHCGILIYIPAGVCLEEPIALVHKQDQSSQAVYLRHLIIAEADSKATVVEDYQGLEGCCYLTNQVTEVFLDAGALVTHYTLQRESKSAYHFSHLAVKQAAYSQFFNHSLSLGGRWVRSDISLYLQEEKAHALMNGIYAPAEGQHIDHHTTVQHLVPDCSSEQDYKGILIERSRAVFNGKIIVAQGAQGTDAKQQNKNLLLSADAEINTKPQLEIFADDVLCTHGATVGQLDEEAVFYLATRGIDRLTASQYLIHAFAKSNMQCIPDTQLADFMRQLLIKQLELT